MSDTPVQFLDVDGVQIAYRQRAPLQTNGVTFVWFSGFMSDMDSTKASVLAKWAAERGAGCFRFDYAGHGKSGGSVESSTVTSWLQQAEAAVRHVDQGPAVFVGSSMGGWMSMLLAQRLVREGRGPQGLVLIAPAWNMTQLMLERAPAEARDELQRTGVYYRPSAYSETPYAITNALIDDGESHLFGDRLPQFGCPVRILHGMRDEDVPWERSLKFVHMVTDGDVTLTLVKDGDHRLSRPQDLDRMFATLSPFLHRPA
jgi:alpha-beta hydrolase superfamily lysophospholipase